jgi:hypothetical protein
MKNLLGFNAMYRGSPVFWRNISPGFMLGLLFDPEDGNDMFLQNVVLSLTYIALQHGRSYCLFTALP